MLLLALLAGAFWLGMQWQAFQYRDACLDLGGGTMPGDYPLCVVERGEGVESANRAKGP